jgi:small-conductance mechanosensitive channel
MFEPITFAGVAAALSTPRGWLELVVVLAAFVAGWLADRWLEQRSGGKARGLKLPGGVVRFAMPLVALLLLVVARPVWKRYAPPLFIDIGLLLAIALAGIRIIVYTLRRLVPNAAWLKGSERSVAFAVWTLVVLQVLGITPLIVEDLDAIRLPLGKHNVSLLSIATGALAVLLTIAVTLWLSGLVEHRLMRTHLDPSQRALASKFVRAVLLVVGVLIAFQAIGFDLTLLSVFGGALGVGIGLGLQKLAANFIAGFVILLDRSIRLGDLITVDNRHGVVTAVTSRYLIVRGMDGVEAIVPNETLVTTTVLNHSLSRRDARIAVTIMVTYGTDLDRALALMCDAAREHPRIVHEGDRAPRAFVVRFAELGVDLELAAWVRDPELGHGDVRSDLNREIWRRFGDAGITVPVTYKEVRVATGSNAAAAGASTPPGG